MRKFVHVRSRAFRFDALPRSSGTLGPRRVLSMHHGMLRVGSQERRTAFPAVVTPDHCGGSGLEDLPAVDVQILEPSSPRHRSCAFGSGMSRRRATGVKTNDQGPY